MHPRLELKCGSVDDKGSQPHIQKAQQGGRYLCGNLGEMRKFREFGWKFLFRIEQSNGYC